MYSAFGVEHGEFSKRRVAVPGSFSAKPRKNLTTASRRKDVARAANSRRTPTLGIQ